MSVYDRWMVVDPITNNSISTRLMPHDVPPDWEPWVQQGMRDHGWRAVRQENYTDLTGVIASEHIPDWRGSAHALANAAAAMLDLAVNRQVEDEEEDPELTRVLGEVRAAVDRFRTTVMEESLADQPSEDKDEDEPREQ